MKPKPAAPVAPVAPVSPCGPCNPVAPVKPCIPCAPVSPIGPCGPVAPVAPPRTNTLRPTEPAPIPVQEAPIRGPDNAIDADDAVLLSLFRKRMPERLQALKEARSRGDHEKVLRVITSIRPQLVHHDAERFTELCTRLIAAGPTVLEETARSERDGFISDVERSLGGPFSGK